jgi:hypothetical protein
MVSAVSVAAAIHGVPSDGTSEPSIRPAATVGFKIGGKFNIVGSGTMPAAALPECGAT